MAKKKFQEIFEISVPPEAGSRRFHYYSILWYGGKISVKKKFQEIFEISEIS